MTSREIGRGYWLDDLGDGFWNLKSPDGRSQIIKKSKSHLSIWDGGWKELVRTPKAPWSLIIAVLKGLGKL